GFRATNFGMELEVESYSQDSNNDVSVYTNAGFAYGDDIVIQLQAAAFNAYDTDAAREYFSSGARMQLSLWKKLDSIGGYNHSIGTRWRSEQDRERLYARYKYSTSVVSGWFDGMHTWKNTSTGDSWAIEAMPVILKYNGFGVGYYMFAEKANTTEFENFKHQVRMYTPSYNFTDKFSVNAEYRLWLGEETTNADGTKKYGYSSDMDAAKGHYLQLNWSYDYSEALNLYAYTGYEFAEWNYADGRDNRSYSDIGAGFNYKF
ncbi:MAG: hypothetical protein ACRCZH_00865, partial [Cetobacterium sp.]